MSGSGNGSGLEANWSDGYNYSSGNYSGDNGDNGIDWLKVVKNTIIYVLPVIIIGGTVGNVLSMVTLCSRHFRHAPCTVLLFILAVVDTLVLLYDGGLHWWVNVFHHGSLELLTQNDPRLECSMFLVRDAVRTLSPWTVVLVTFERFVSVMWPFRAGIICSKRKMVISWLLVLLIIILLYSYFHFKLFDASCEPSFANLLYLNWTRFASVCVGPLVLIVAGNAGIIYKTCVASRNRTRTVDSSSPAAASAASDARSITIMLVVVCVVFVVTTYPLYVILCGLYFYKYSSQVNRMFRVVFVLYYVNSATNFILYFTTGRLFRKAFLQVMCRCNKRQASPRHNVQSALRRGNCTGETKV